MDDLLAEMVALDRADRAYRCRRARLGGAATVIALAGVGLGSLTGGALSTDTRRVNVSDITTGSLDLAAEQSAVQEFNAEGLAPGDTVYGALSVRNQGTLALRYAVQVSRFGPLGPDVADQVWVAVYAGLPSCDAAGSASVLPIARLRGLPGATTALVGDPAPGQQTGDRVLAAAAAEELCVSATLPAGATASDAGGRAMLSFTFLAEQADLGVDDVRGTEG